ncbi:hypothetical protein P3S68_027986 [Capsicum galapagoense]
MVAKLVFITDSVAVKILLYNNFPLVASERLQLFLKLCYDQLYCPFCNCGFTVSASACARWHKSIREKIYYSGCLVS